MPVSPAILVEGISKSYGKTPALVGLDLEVEAGSVFGALGPNGAGKTTAVRILTTLLKPDSGRAEVVGKDVVKQAAEARAQIGVAGQYAAVDELLTGYENLVLFGRLSHVSAAAAKRRARDLLERLDLAEVANRLVKTYSGGMRRRLDLAACLIMAPPVLFLDEPTTGLDPRGRLVMWALIRELAQAGATIFLTTQYLDEADHLAQQIAVIDHGRVIARGAPDELKAQIGGERLEITLEPGSDLEAALAALNPYRSGAAQMDTARRRLSVPVTHGAQRLAAMVRDLDAAQIALTNLALRGPTLDDVFLSLTGHEATAANATTDPIAEPQRVTK